MGKEGGREGERELSVRLNFSATMTSRKSNRTFAPSLDRTTVINSLSRRYRTVPSGLSGRHAYVGACAINDSELSIMKTGRERSWANACECTREKGREKKRSRLVRVRRQRPVH